MTGRAEGNRSDSVDIVNIACRSQDLPPPPPPPPPPLEQHENNIMISFQLCVYISQWLEQLEATGPHCVLRTEAARGIVII